ncbi:orotidine-5'-phosphate decarboxylase [Paenibacillus thermotolerans]|uniref:orotidine-5'-phosphate decarboxylase n=1 Tax=Paenibacillus thermotolerans TaxID=3027807 RepID=UPI00236883BB|nr:MULTISPECIES: orotidine-5'-phosphate decarboxylase [unclassified Paenibacillus]
MADRNAIAERIMVALDVPEGDAALELARRFEGIPCWMKIGMELYYAAGPSVVREIKALGHRVFLDLKLHDIPNTVRGASRSVTRLGVDMFNVHAAGGTAMMKAAVEGALEAAGERGAMPIIIGVTQLTSTDERMLNEEIGIPGSVDETVVRYSRLVQSAGLQGVVASARESAAIKSACGSGFVTVTPGIRPAGADVGDQARVVTPKAAIEGGSDLLVIGRPITGAADPRAALLRIVDEFE